MCKDYRTLQNGDPLFADQACSRDASGSFGIVSRLNDAPLQVQGQLTHYNNPRMLFTYLEFSIAWKRYIDRALTSLRISTSFLLVST